MQDTVPQVMVLPALVLQEIEWEQNVILQIRRFLKRVRLLLVIERT